MRVWRGRLRQSLFLLAHHPVSRQDIVALTNTRSSDINRWMAHLVEIPSGSLIAPASAEKGSFSTKSVTHVLGVQTTEALHVMDVRHILDSGKKLEVNRAMMGDRVVYAEAGCNRCSFNLSLNP